MKLFFSIILISLTVNLLAQTIPVDTSYYDNGSIKSILFQRDFEITGNQVHVFYTKTTDKKKLGTRLTDTLYEHQPSWAFILNIKLLNPNLIRISRSYLPDSSCIEKRIFISNYAPLTFSFSSITIYFKKEKISITYHFRNKKLIALYIGEEDLFRKKQFNCILNVLSKKDLNFQYQDFLITNNRKIRIENFDSTMYISRIIFQNTKGFWNGSYIEFYSNSMPKEFGKFEIANKQDVWCEYFEDGSLKAKGQYAKTKFDEIGQAIFLKDGNWIFYDGLGNFTKKEKWKNGTLIK